MVTLKLFNVRSHAHRKTTLRQCCEKLFIPLLILTSSLGFSPKLQAQDDSPCECVQRWEGGAHWNDDGTINDAPNAPAPLGVIRCASAAETQSQIKPNTCTYNPAEFSIDVSESNCIDPSTGASVSVANPTEGEPIIWLNFDVRPHANEFEVQINDNSKDKIGFALYYSASPTSGLNANGISGDCSNLILVACGVESSNTWNTLPVPDFAEPTNYYLAIWDQDADGELKLNNFKARFGCSEEAPPSETCALELIECPETAKVSCGDPIDPLSLGLPFDPEECSNIEIDYSDVIGGVCAETLTIKRIWTFSDQSGSSITCDQMIEFVDETAPIIEEIEDYTLEDCDAEWPALSTEWSDNCGNGGQVEGEAGDIMMEDCLESRVYTFTVSDDCGNEAISTTTVTRKLAELVLSCPDDKTMEACASQAAIDAAFEAFLEKFGIASGCNANGDFTAEYSAPDKCGGLVEVSYTAIADCGEPQTCTATFTVPECTTGECGSCPEACAISGDQLVCPNEVVSYTVAFENGCENPEVIWSLNETYNDATILSQDGADVTLKIDNNCEGWVELIATIKCEGCDDVVCKYPIDVVLTDIVFETPDEVSIDACTDATDIEAAFEAFLKDFEVSGGCNVKGEFKKEYSLPEVCGGSIEVVYNAIADCGQVSSTSATFTIEACEDGSCKECPESCSISGDQLVCPGEIVSYTVAVDEACENQQVIWSLNGTYNDATIVSTDGNSVVLKIDDNCDAWVELIATIKCDGCEEIVCKYPIDVVLTELVLDCPDDVVLEACSSQEDIDAAFADFLNAFSFEGGCSAEDGFEAEYSAPNKCGGIVEVKYLVTESCGETKTCSATFKIGICEDGSCNTCEGSCLIDGKIAACPSEELVYTLDLEGTCAEPEVIWTLDGDAEIVEAGAGQVTIKATDECEGWFTLKATIKCDNCPPVYCEKTVDVVRHKLVVECPDDVMVDACLSDVDLAAAFADFLSNFGFSGGCGDGYGEFYQDYSAPTACGESVTVKYMAQDNCGQYEICTATFSIKECGQTCTPEIKDLEDLDLEGCGAAWPTLETQWWDDCGGDGKVLGVPGEVMTIDDCYQYRIYTFTIHNECGEDAQTTTKVTRQYDMTAPIISIPNLNIDLVTCIDEIPTPENLEALIKLSLFDNCDDSPDIMISADGSPECMDGSFSYTFKVKVCDDCGNCDEIAITYRGSCNGTPGEEQTFCTLTQGGWGNPGGKYPWKAGEMASTTEIITGLMEVYGDVVIGDTLANVLRITDPECVVSLLPSGGNPDVLPEGEATASSDNDCTPYTNEHLTGSGRLKNTLAGQAIALQLNIWYTLEVSGSDLGALPLESLSAEGTDVLPDSVNTVAELLAFANLYLGGTVETDKELEGSLTDLLASVNEFFDGCSEVAFDACGLGLDLGLGDGKTDGASENTDEEKGILEAEMEASLKVWPNPASKQLTLRFKADEKGVTRVRLIDPSGKPVFDGTFPVTKGTNAIVVPIDGFPTGIYTIMTMQADKQLMERVVITKR